MTNDVSKILPEPYDMLLPNLSEENIEEITNWLGDTRGYEYEVDFECLYGAGWKLTGIRFMNRVALEETRAMLRSKSW